MYLPTHLAAGLVIGKITGDYTAAMLGSLLPDSDHFYSYIKHKAFTSLKNLKAFITDEDDPHDDQRNIFHNIIFAILVWIIMMFISLPFGIIFTASHLIHLFMDSMDGADYYPFYPNKKINLKGPIGFFSKWDVLISVVLILFIS